MDLSKALDKLMALPADKAREYAKQYVDQLREVDSVAMPTTPDVVRTAALKQVARLPIDDEDTEDNASAGSAGSTDDGGEGAEGESDSQS